MGPRHVVMLFLVACLLAAGGCVSPGEMDAGAIGRYQRALAERASRVPRGGPGAEGLQPSEAFSMPNLPTDPVVERVTLTTRTYEGKIAPEGPLARDRIKTIAVVTEFDLRARSDEADPNTARVVGRTEIETIRAFRLEKEAKSPDGKPRQTLVKTVEKKTTFVRDAKSGKLVRSAETVTTSSYKEVAGKPGAPVDEEDGTVEVKANVKTTRFLPRPAGGAKASEADTAGRISVPEFEALAGRVTDSKSTRKTHVGRKHAEPALLERSRRIVRLSLPDAIRGALARNLDVRVVSFSPAISREQMAQAAAAFDYAVFLNMNFSKVEGENESPGGLFQDVQRWRKWSAGVRQRAVTGASWTLRSTLSRNWDATDMDGLYKSAAALEVTQPLLRGAWPAYNLASLRIARINSKISDAAFREEVDRVLSEVLLAYGDLVRARRTMRIRQGLIDRTLETLDQLRARRRFDVTRAVVKQVEVALKERTAELIDARQAIGEGQDRLVHLVPDGQLTGSPRPEIVPITPPFEGKLRLNAGEQLMTAVRHSPLLEQTRLGIATAKIDISVAENETLPILNLFAAVESQDFRRSLKRGENVAPDQCILGYQFDLLLDYPIGNRLALARLRETKFAHAQAIATMQQTVNTLALEISQRIRRIRRAHEKVQAHRQVVEVARDQLQAMAESEQIPGRLTPGFLRAKLRAQRDLALAKERAEQAVFDHNAARAELNRTTGTLLKLHRVEIALPAIVSGRWPNDAAPTTPPATGPAKKP